MTSLSSPARGGPLAISVFALFAAVGLTTPLQALNYQPSELGVTYIDGRSPLNQRGHSIFRTIQVEVVGTQPWIARHLLGSQFGASISYSDIVQARSWFGYQYGEPNDHIRGEAAQAFVRKSLGRTFLGIRPYAEIGTGLMWSNRRVPAATSRLNAVSFGVLGGELFSSDRWPLRIGYRFSHISDGGATGRNPGLNVHTFFIGARIRRMR